MKILIEPDNTRYKKVENFLKHGILEIDNLQSYIPATFDNKIKTNKWTTLKSFWRLKEVTSWKTNDFKGTIIDLSGNVIHNCPFYIRHSPLMNIFHLMYNAYPLHTDNIWMPHNVNKFTNLCSKIYKINNTAFVDTKCSILLSQLNDYCICPNFPSVLGTYLGVTGDYSLDFSHEYKIYKNEKWFKKALKKKLIRIKQYSELADLDKISDSIKVCDLDILEPTVDIEKNHKDNEIEGDENIDKISIIFQRMPIQILLFEKLDKTFMDLIDEELRLCRPKIRFPNYTIDSIENFEDDKDDIEQNSNDDLVILKKLFFDKLKAWLFQLCLALSCANDKIGFVHNDFHIQNIMSKKTNEQFLYYSYKGTKYRVPTYGQIMKIIDFGRSTFIYDKNLYIGDVYESDGDAYGQYILKKSNSKNKKKQVTPCSGFDLPFFSNSFLEEFEDEKKWPTLEDILNSDIGKLIYSWMNDDEGRNFFGEIKGFKICKYIARNFRKNTPSEQIKNELFHEYLIDSFPNNIKVYAF